MSSVTEEPLPAVCDAFGASTRGDMSELWEQTECKPHEKNEFTARRRRKLGHRSRFLFVSLSWETFRSKTQMVNQKMWTWDCDIYVLVPMRSCGFLCFQTAGQEMFLSLPQGQLGPNSSTATELSSFVVMAISSSCRLKLTVSWMVLDIQTQKWRNRDRQRHKDRHTDPD